MDFNCRLRLSVSGQQNQDVQKAAKYMPFTDLKKAALLRHLHTNNDRRTKTERQNSAKDKNAHQIGDLSFVHVIAIFRHGAVGKRIC